MRPRFVGGNSQKPKQKTAAPYIRGVTERIKKILKPHKINLFSRNKSSIRVMACKTEDKKSSKDRKKVSYKINCNDCGIKEKVVAQRDKDFRNMRRQ